MVYQLVNFIWADDLEYSLRISKLYPCFFVYRSQVVHKMVTNSDTRIAYSGKIVWGDINIYLETDSILLKKWKR